MSQEEERLRRQPANPDGQGQDRPGGGGGGGPVRYGDVFDVEGELARTPIAPQDAAMMQAAENAVLGRAPRGGTAAAAMQSAARRNERLGVVARDEAATDGAAAECGVAVTEARVPGARVVTEFVADQPVGQYTEAAENDAAEEAGELGGGGPAGMVRDGTKITIGEALEATAFSAGDQPVERSDAAVIAAAEARATGTDEAPPDGLAARARAAADANALARREEDRATLRDVLADATSRLGADKEVEREDAARVVGAEVRGGPDAAARPGGVAASIAAAARLNRGRQ
ncbi:late embryogenesis abundant protein D-34-like [Panicum miliaceum]|uniref:Late embryogenesis abundant protein D-34-like n=1 Tax=Panicum miliaceum TaxID=4540 RepID=A0A3L6S580_PANMI|nr:late embryogenesis abundant protein D-34-like [Panicum miliaceum]